MRTLCGHCLLPAAIVIGVCATAQAQQVGSVRGVVKDRDFDLPLRGVEVVITGTDQKTVTSEQGNYSFAKVPPGTYTLVFRKEGFVRVIKTDVVVRAGSLTERDVALAGDFTDMEEYVVEDILQLGGSSEFDLLQLRFESPAMMDSIGADMMSQSGSSDAASALRLVSGASLQDGKSAVIRGLPDRYVSSQMNGVRLPTADENKRAVELDQFPSQIIESLQVSKTFTPDQQGDSSGGAVNVVLKGLPHDKFYFKVGGQTGYNSQVTGRDLLTYEGGGVRWDGRSRTWERRIQWENLPPDEDADPMSWDGPVGTSFDQSPTDYKLNGAIGGRFEIADGVNVGGLLSLFYERDSSMYRNGVDDNYWVEGPGEPMTPRWNGEPPTPGEPFTTELFDVTKGKQSVQWGTMATTGIETKNHSISLVVLQTKSSEDTAVLAEDTRGKHYYYPGYDPENPYSNGFADFQSAPYLRLQTMSYRERDTKTLQLAGRHILDVGSSFAPKFDWSLSRSKAAALEPDKRQFGSKWTPGFSISGFTLDPSYTPYKPAVNFSLGNFQRIWKSLEEDSEQGAFNLELPFSTAPGAEGYLKAGLFYDDVRRDYVQESFVNFGDNSSSVGPWEVPWTVNFPYEEHPLSAANIDVNYLGTQRLKASYLMCDLPITSTVNFVGGIRWEKTNISILNFPDEGDEIFWYPTPVNPGDPLTPTVLHPGDADVDFSRNDALPALSLIARPLDGLTLRGSYSKTVARQTFKELTPIQQQEYLGGPVFIGNPELQMSLLRNYDLRADYEPYQGGLLSASWFRKEIDDPIEYVQKSVGFTFTTPENFPAGRLEGFEFETRHQLGQYWDLLDGIGIGANATFIDSRVTLSERERTQFAQAAIEAPVDHRNMTNAPNHLYNLYLTYD
ncbi:MAG: carboxypeptidase regulatory-like domain-containing protein, partial [Planctomycetes bacterium]|nr:carboxypeptidase regulatory-like domain-containing protein [Planctomycetota bacterium]